ncbi:MAG TPA: alkaline phosphatase family protein [Gaiellaceae bacterium]|nr:alkaline phosphatase family protein [Gaiellaceae bacterium]
MRLRAGTLGMLTALVAAVVAATVPTAATAAQHQPKTPIQHFITLMQENHTYDNYFGTYPRGNGLPANVCVPIDPRKPHGRCIRPFRLGSNQVVPADPDHSSTTARLQFDHGRLNGFVSALDSLNQDGRLAMGYRDGSDLPYYWNLADKYVLYDRFFSSAMAGSFLNHLYWVSGGPGGGYEHVPRGGFHKLRTIFDRLEASGVSWKFYVQNYNPHLTFRTLRHFPANRASQVVWVPLLSMPRYLDNPQLRSHIVPLSQYYNDLLKGTLPAVSYIVPSGPSEHPPSSVASGQASVRSLINSLIASPEWKSSAFLLSYDDWGGWYDHVKPPQIDKYGYGFRVPALLVSPYAKRGFIDNTQLDFTSILRFIESNWGLKPLTARDGHANSIATGFDFQRAPRPAIFTSATRGSTLETNVRRPLIYLFYGGAFALPMLLIAFALVTGRRRRGTASATPEGDYG